MNVFDKVPSVDKTAFVAPSASLVGDVQVGPGSSIWYGCVLRGWLCFIIAFCNNETCERTHLIGLKLNLQNLTDL